MSSIDYTPSNYDNATFTYRGREILVRSINQASICAESCDPADRMFNGRDCPHRELCLDMNDGETHRSKQQIGAELFFYNRNLSAYKREYSALLDALECAGPSTYLDKLEQRRARIKEKIDNVRDIITEIKKQRANRTGGR